MTTAETPTPTPDAVVDEREFNPRGYLTNIKGALYLPVAARIAWFRHDHPDAIVETDQHHITNEIAIFHARVTTTAGGSSTGWGSCTSDEFDNYIEKAETKALGRALAALGYGTLGTDDFDDTGALADTPVGPAPARNGSGPRRNGSPSGGDAATSAQRSMIRYKAKQANMEPERLVAFIREITGKGFDELTKRDASRVIDAFGETQGPGPGPDPVRTMDPGRQPGPDRTAALDDARNRMWGAARKAGLEREVVLDMIQGELGKAPGDLTLDELLTMTEIIEKGQ